LSSKARETLSGVNNGIQRYMYYIYIYIYRTSDLTFVAQAQNYIIWAEFSINHLFSIGLPVATVEKELLGW